MKKTPRSRMSAAARRTQILDITRQLVVSDGFSVVTIERVAKECGITRTLIYQQFGSLSAMLVLMVDRELQNASAGLVKAMSNSSQNPQDRFVSTLAGLLRAVQDEPETWRMLLMPTEGGPPELYERLAKALEFTYQFLGSGLDELKKKTPNLADVDHEITVHLMHAVGDELVKLHLKNPIEYSEERLLKHAKWASKAFFRVD